MISKNKIKYIQSLHRKKNRDKEGLYIVEGDKMISELIEDGKSIKILCATDEFLSGLNTNSIDECIESQHEELKKISLLQTPQHAIAIIEKEESLFDMSELRNKFTLALDDIQDPGNLGTILRTADWFGVENIICSKNTVDCYNPKVIQASMGAIFRVKIHYVDLQDALAKLKGQGVQVYGTFLDGNNIYTEKLSKNAVLVIGNEGNGISTPVESMVNSRIHIPSATSNGSESLNAGVATAICCSEFYRNNMNII